MKQNNIEFKKKNFKIIVILCFVFGILVFIIYKILTPISIIPIEIHELNENVNIPYKFATPLENYSFDSEIWEQSSEYNSISFKKDEYECFTFEGYPDYADSYKFTNYWSNNPDTSIFGIHVGDNLESIDKIMKNYGYWQEDNLSSYIKYTKGRVSIWIKIETLSSSGTNTISSRFDIQIKSTDWLHKGYYK